MITHIICYILNPIPVLEFPIVRTSPSRPVFGRGFLYFDWSYDQLVLNLTLLLSVISWKSITSLNFDNKSSNRAFLSVCAQSQSLQSLERVHPVLQLDKISCILIGPWICLSSRIWFQIVNLRLITTLIIGQNSELPLGMGKFLILIGP